MIYPLDSAITLLWLIFWGMFALFKRFKVMLIAFSATLLYIFLNLDLPVITENGILWYDLLLYALLLFDLSLEKEK